MKLLAVLLALGFVAPALAQNLFFGLELMPLDIDMIVPTFVAGYASKPGPHNTSFRFSLGFTSPALRETIWMVNAGLGFPFPGTKQTWMGLCVEPWLRFRAGERPQLAWRTGCKIGLFPDPFGLYLKVLLPVPTRPADPLWGMTFTVGLVITSPLLFGEPPPAR